MKTVETRIKIALGRNKDLDQKKENLQYIGRTIPYGYKKINNQLVPDKECSHIVYLIFDLYDKGYSNTKIANYLNERGITSPSEYKKIKQYISVNQSALWDKSGIRKIISNKVYTGSYHYTNKKTHKALISEKLFMNVYNRKIEKQNYSGNDFYHHNGNEFNSKVYCKECGRVFTMESSQCKNGKEKYLRCSSYDTRREKKVNCSNRLSIRYDELKNITQMFIEQEIFSKMNMKDIENLYSFRLKEDDIANHRIYLKQERELLKNKIKDISVGNYNENNLIEKLDNIKNVKLLSLYNRRLDEIEKQLAEIRSFCRTKEIKKSEFYIDKFIIDCFVERITVDSIKGNERNILIELK